jgi:hypothetical protein
MTTQRPLRFSRGCWSLSISTPTSESAVPLEPPKVGAQLVNDLKAADSKAIDLKLSVPKRVLKQAVRRNQAKRVARESWRSFECSNLYLPMDQQLFGKSLLLRLSRRPQLEKQNGQEQGVGVNPASARAAKLIMRADCDALFAQVARYLGNRSHAQ